MDGHHRRGMDSADGAALRKQATGTVSFTVAANTGQVRTPTWSLLVSGQPSHKLPPPHPRHLRRRSPPPPPPPPPPSPPPSCTFTISPTSQSVGAGGGSGSVAVSAPADCPDGTTSASWIKSDVGIPSGTGSGSVAFTVNANTGGALTGA